MLLSSKPKINEVIVSLLAAGPVDTLDLLTQTKNRTKVSKTGFYKALRELLAEEVVTKNKQTVLLSTIWVNKVASFTEDVQNHYLAKASEQILSLSEGDSMTFKFKSILDLDILWMHYFYMIVKQIDAPVLFYTYHEFWSLFRSDLQNQMYQWIKTNNKKTYFVIGNNSPLDIETTKPHKSYGLEIAYESKTTLSPNIGFTIIGDYIFNTIIDATTIHAIDALYVKYQKWQPSIATELNEIISRMRRSKVVIERNKKKAEMLRKKLMKYFVFYK